MKIQTQLVISNQAIQFWALSAVAGSKRDWPSQKLFIIYPVSDSLWKQQLPWIVL